DLASALAVWPMLSNSPVPCVVDFPDLVHERIAQELDLAHEYRALGSGGLRSRYRRQFLRRNMRSWTGWSSRVARIPSLVVVTKEEDAQSLGAGAFEVVPNGADVGELRARPPGNHPPTVVFVGTLGYEPNFDAARYLVDVIRPRLVDACGGPVAIR